MDVIRLIMESYDPIRTLPVFSDRELRRLDMPVLFIDGEVDLIVDAKRSAQRPSGVLPSTVLHLLPDSGHVVADAIGYIIPFLMAPVV